MSAKASPKTTQRNPVSKKKNQKHIYMQTHRETHTHTHTHTYTHTYTQIQTQIHTCTYTYTHIYIHESRRHIGKKKSSRSEKETREGNGEVNLIKIYMYIDMALL